MPTAWCGGEFRSGRAGAYAVAILSTRDGGRYAVLEADGATVALASFTGRPDLSCYTPAEARTLNVTIGQSDTVRGALTPRWQTTVVCGFVESTMAVCWQYSPDARAFVVVGGWET